MDNVRMGEMAVVAHRGDELVVIGLGSCIGLALIDIQGDVVGLAHVVLPDSQGASGPPGKFGDLVVPAMLHLVDGAGANRRRLQAVLVGGARMFSLGSIGDIGARNAVAVRAALKSAGIRIYGEDTGGNRGRTARIVVGQTMTVQLAGGERRTLLDLARPSANLRPLGKPGLTGARR
jgi:chemotaxis protein CheD